ncbi:hypothetical protein [Bradyrhizobium sp. ISRA443]|uniref:hypothetical protein n=1 Tax=unclassified Bradyrhizobium TaxID=2631580 RepID=UPI0032AED9F5
MRIALLRHGQYYPEIDLPDLIRATASAALCNGMVSMRGRTPVSTLKSRLAFRNFERTRF